jgi:glycerol-3-phosphate acyltransferase PlsX
MKIGLDVLGGDFAPKAAIHGAILAKESLSLSDRIVLLGDRDVILSFFRE